MALTHTEESMRNILHSKNVFGIALLLGGLVVVGFLVVGVSEAQEIPLFNRDVVLLDCVEDANAFVVKTVSSTLEVDIHQGLDCAAAVQKLFARGFVLGPGTGGATSAVAPSLNHFLMLFVLDTNSLISPSDCQPLNPSQNCVLGQNIGCPTVQRQGISGPTLNTQQPPVLQPLSPILQPSTSLHRSTR